MQCDLLTFNLRYDNPGDGERSWENRRSQVAQYLQTLRPSLMALQEVLPHQRQDLEQALPDYRSYGIGRDGQGRGEQCCWLIGPQWEIRQAYTRWLSPSPDRPSRGWDALLPRVVSVLEVAAAENSVWLANLHLDHLGVEARHKGLEQVAALAPPHLPSLVAGDFNQVDLWKECAGLDQWQDAQALAGKGAWGTFHDFEGGQHGPRIDAILASPQWKLLNFSLGEDSTLSDHYPLWAQFSL